MASKVRKAVFPAAGLGTRFLPATKAQPKEMLPLVDKPLIQYGVEEALHSGIQNIIIVTGRGKSAIEDHFDVSFELENMLETRGKKDLLSIVRNVSDMINVSYTRQKEALGLGHAVLRAMELVGRRAVRGGAGGRRDRRRNALPAPVAGRLRVLLLAGAGGDGGAAGEHFRLWRDRRRADLAQRLREIAYYRIRDLVEKPKPSEAPSNLAIIGRYVLIPEIFQSLQAIEPGSGSEIQLTDALRHLLRTRPIYAYRFEGTRYDAGDKLGFLKATVEFALRRHDLGGPFREYLKGLSL